MTLLLDDVLARLQALPAKERKEIEALADEATKGMKWIPTAGPQLDAYYCPADVLLYGGQGGGGKTDLGLGLAFTAHKRSLILRRQYANLSAITERAVEINGTRTGFNGSPPPLLRTDDGRYIQFGANQHLGDEQAWQGHAFDFKCVGRGTPVLMADGSYSAIEVIRQGDLVATLEGPKRVTRVWPRRRDQAVRVTWVDQTGAECSQDQSLTHEVLTPYGWACHDTSAEASRPSICVSTGYRGSRKSSGLFSRLCAVLKRHLGCFLTGLPRSAGWLRGSWRAGSANSLGTSAFAVQQPSGSGVAASYGLRPRQQPLVGLFGLAARLKQDRASSGHSVAESTASTRDCDAGSWSVPSSFLGRCSFGNRLHGGRARQHAGRGFAGVDVLTCLQQPSGAGQPSPTCSEGDGRDRTPTHSRHTRTYSHPYTRETRSVAQGASLEVRPFTFSLLGEIDLFDIEVEEVNHYITKGGIVNRNCFDEATQFLESQVRFHLGWLRSVDPKQRCRAVLGSNPPISAEGDWIIGMFRPWLDITHPNPAKPGELRWFVTAPDGSDLEVDGPTPVEMAGQKLVPSSRSFIPAALRDNPFLARTNYQSKLDALPEPLRSAVRDGNFMAARTDAEFQVIPAQWAIEAQARWKPNGGKDFAMTAMALDPAGGGKDAEELCWRNGGWYSEVISAKGEKTAGAQGAATAIFLNRRDGAPVVIDSGGGYAGAVIERLTDNKVPFIRFNGAASGIGKTRDSNLPFANKRSEAFWRFREALDPNKPGGSEVALPPDPELLADLTAPCLDPKALEQRGVIQVEPKDNLRKRLGRSPGKGDVVVMCWSEGNAAVKRAFKASSGERPTRVSGGLMSRMKRR